MDKFSSIIERAIIRSHKLDKLLTNNTLKDFKVEDIVKCTYMKGLYRVLGHNDGKVIITKVDYSGDLEYISPNFLLNINNIDKKWVSVLYDY